MLFYQRVYDFLVVAEYVARRLQASRRPADVDLAVQYRDLILHWCKLFKRSEVRSAILLPREKNAKQGLGSASIVAADCKLCESQTGLAEHGSEVISPGLEFKYSFQSSLNNIVTSTLSIRNVSICTCSYN